MSQEMLKHKAVKNPSTFSDYLQFSIKLGYINTGKAALSPFADH